VPDSSDEQLMLNYREGDNDAFATLYRRHRGPLYRYMLHGCNDKATADELFQDVWTGLIDARERYRADATFKTYLFRLAHNRLVDHYRRSRLRAVEDCDHEEIAQTGPSLDHGIADRDCVERLKREIGDLPAEQRDAFVLKEETGLSLEQIGAVVGVERETVKSRLRYAMKRLRQVLEDCL
jgi:RNA polymerase sigma-70 factor (ECF subfamily)